MGSAGNCSAVQREREAKLRAPEGFELPDLGDVVPGVVAESLSERNLDAVYYDTGDLRLARAEITVRHRTGEDAPAWTVKFPESGQRGPALTRREIGLPGADDAPPVPVADLVLAYTRRRRLAPVARLRTRRRPVELRDGEGRRVAEVVDDEVTVTRADRRVLEFREVEVEVYAGGRLGRELLKACVRRLVQAGAVAGPPVPKLVRALGDRATRPADVVERELPGSPTVADLAQQAIAGSVAQMQRHDPGARMGADPEDVHRLRVAARRLRSDLRTFSGVLDEGRGAEVRVELGRLGREVGAVRDADVLGARLESTSRTLPAADRQGAALLLARLRVESDTARAAMLESLRRRSYLQLLDSLVSLAAQPPLREPGAVDADATAPSSPDRGSAGRLVRRPWRRLKHAVAALGPDPSDAQLHRVRILAKRCRYAAEAVAPLAAGRVEKFAARMADVQTVLGEHQDTVVAEEWLRAAAAADPAAGLAAGQLIAVERARRAELRTRWRAVWDEASPRKLRRWM